MRSFITIRQERFGALAFNPYLGIEIELDTVEAYCVALCDGRNSLVQVGQGLKKRFSFDENRCLELRTRTFEKLSGLGAIELREGFAAERLRLPDWPVFLEDGPILSAPKGVVWDCTHRCNLRCLHCLTASGAAAPGELSTQEAMQLIDALAAMKVFNLSLTGGEPFLRADLLTLLHHIAKTNLRTDIATNGVALPRGILSELRELPVFQVQVSIDGIGSQHDRFRGLEGAFNASCQTIRQMQDEGISVSISTTVTRENVNELDRLIDMALSMGCSGYKAIPFLPAGRGKEHSAQFQLDRQGYRRFAETLVRRKNELKGKMNVSTNTCFGILLEPPPLGNVKTAPMGCSAGYDTLNIGPDGTVYPCPFFQNMPLGNALEKPVKAIWMASSFLRSLRTLRKEQMEEPCRECAYAPERCRGGCRAAAWMTSGSLLAADPMCFA
jgi:radical SAM protein with 4Fe4S-binding SPASM domain